jgi:hypothetical protein
MSERFNLITPATKEKKAKQEAMHNKQLTIQHYNTIQSLGCGSILSCVSRSMCHRNLLRAYSIAKEDVAGSAKMLLITHMTTRFHISKLTPHENLNFHKAAHTHARAHA